MKKILFGIVALALSFQATAQTTPIADLLKKANKAVKSANDDKKIGEAKTAIDALFAAPEAKTSAEAWLVKAKLPLALLSLDDSERQLSVVTKKEFKAKYTASALDASVAIKEAAKLGNKDNKAFMKDFLPALTETEGGLSNAATEYLAAKEYEQSFAVYSNLIEVNSIFKKYGGKSIFAEPAKYKELYTNAALLSIIGKKEADALGIYEQMIAEKNDTSFVYDALYRIYNAKGDNAKAISYLDAGRKRFPDDSGLLFTEINVYLSEGKLDVLIDKLKQGIAKEPNNTSLYFTLGNVYDQLSQKEKDAAKAQELIDEAFKYYDQTIAKDPKNVEAYYSKGAIYYNRAANQSQELVALSNDMSREGEKKYQAIEKQMNANFDAALPFFQKAESVNPNDKNTLTALKEIYAKKGEFDKSNELKARLETVMSGGTNPSSYFKN